MPLTSFACHVSAWDEEGKRGKKKNATALLKQAVAYGSLFFDYWNNLQSITKWCQYS